ncbi:8668_t:CDS:2, partial [Gigaspora margarita]
SEWKKAASKQVTNKDKYLVDHNRWICSCCSFLKSRFYICKHLVAPIGMMDSDFFHKVCRNKTYPLIFKTDQTIWKLIKEDKTISNNFINLSYKNINTISNSEVIVNEIDDETNSSDDESTVEIVERLSKILNE